MTRLFLAAGVAALAIATPAAAGPHGGGGPHGKADQAKGHGGGPQAKAQHGGGQQAKANRGGGQMARPQQMKQMRAETHQARPQEMKRAQRVDHQQMRAERQQVNRKADRQQMRAERQQAKNVDRQQMHADRGQMKKLDRQQVRVDRQSERMAKRDLRIDNREIRTAANGKGYGVGGCPPGLADKGCMPPGLAKQDQLQALRRVNAQAFQDSRIQMMTPQTRILAPTEALRYIGAPLSTVQNYVPLAALPGAVSYLYPDTQDYYYRYGDGYLYQVDRSSDLILSLLPLLGGGYLPGTYLPQQYMSNYVPDAYGLNSFYPANYSNYGANSGFYGNTCNRYANGVVYQVDCGSGLVQNIVPTYAGGYGVGQMLPSSYSYYNVPTQYRSMYYPTNDTSYWYAPGAIYQYDPSSSLITSVAALLSPGFSVGQQLPAGYNMYNVPMAYRSTYYDTPEAWYRYNNGNIYQVDPTTQLVTAIVASLLT